MTKHRFEFAGRPLVCVLIEIGLGIGPTKPLHIIFDEYLYHVARNSDAPFKRFPNASASRHMSTEMHFAGLLRTQDHVSSDNAPFSIRLLQYSSDAQVFFEEIRASSPASAFALPRSPFLCQLFLKHAHSDWLSLLVQSRDAGGGASFFTVFVVFVVFWAEIIVSRLCSSCVAVVFSLCRIVF
jgi:hypothetical protein